MSEVAGEVGYTPHDLRARLEEESAAWLWHDETEDVRAGHGHHMGQMLYRLPRDGQTDDMKASIEQMLADLDSAIYALSRVEALAEEWDADLDSGRIRDLDARYCWNTALNELRRAMTPTPTTDSEAADE